MARVPRLWPASTVVCVGTGPSLRREDVEACRDLPTIAISDAFMIAPWAKVLYSCDRRWWRAHPETEGFKGLKFGLEGMPERPDVTILENTGDEGLELQPTGLRTGKNSGYQAINLAVHLGASRILLLGYDMQIVKGQLHFFGPHKWMTQPPPFEYFRAMFRTMVEPLAQAGVTVINCTPRTALKCFPCQSLQDALAPAVA